MITDEHEIHHELGEMADLADKIHEMTETPGYLGEEYSFSQMLKLYQAYQLDKISKELKNLCNILDKQQKETK